MLDNKSKIDILLKEYDVLQREVANRIHNRFLMLGTTITFSSFAIFSDNKFLQSQIYDINIRKIILVAGSTLLLVTWLRFGYHIKKLTGRISDIEQQINTLADEELLKWETHYGWGKYTKKHNSHWFHISRYGTRRLFFVQKSSNLLLVVCSFLAKTLIGDYTEREIDQ